MKYKTSHEKINVLLIDDDEEDYLLTRKLFSQFKDKRHHLDWASSFEKGLEILLRNEHVVCLVDYRLGGRNGVELICKAEELGCQIPMIVLTGQNDHDIDVEAMGAGAADYLVKGETNAAILERTVRYTIALAERKSAGEEGNRFFNVSLDMLCIAGYDGYFKRVNPAWEKTLGFKTEELISKPFIEFVHPEDKHKTIAEAAKLAEGRETVSFENRYLCRDGSYKWLLWNCNPVVNQQLIYAVTHDITQRKIYEQSLRESKEQIANILESITDAFFALDKNWRFTYINPAAERLLLRSQKDLLGKIVWQEFPYAADNAFYVMYHRVRDEKVPVQFTEYYPAPLNAWYEVHAYPAKEGISVYFRDITERREASEKLKQSGERFRALIENSADGITLMKSDGTVIDISPSGERILGYAKEELVGKIRLDLIHPDDVEKVGQTFAEINSKPGKTISDQYRIKHSNGSWLWIESDWNNLLGNLSVHAVVLNYRDITSRKLAEEAIKRSETQFRAVFDNSLDAMLIADDNGKYLDANPAACALLSLTKGEVTKRRLQDFVNPQLKTEDKKGWKAFLDSGSQRGEIELNSPSGKIVNVEFSVTANFLPKQHLFVLRDITERKIAEEALREAESKYRTLVEASPAIVYLTEPQPPYSTIYVTPNIESLGYPAEDWYTKPDMWLSVVYEEDRLRVLKGIESAIKQEIDTQIDYRVVAKDGSVRWWQDKGRFVKDKKGNKIGWQGVILDVTETKKLEEQLRQSQKLESIGRLAGGIAHDFNNMLTAINGYSGLILRQLQKDDPIRSKVEEIKKAGERSASLTQQLLAFSRQQMLQPKVLELDEIINDTSRMLQRLIGEDIQLNIIPNPVSGYIEADPGQLTQVLMNLAVNARDAMPTGGKLTVETANVIMDEKHAASHFPAKPGRYVMLAVTDTGIGMKEETQKRIFEPFFTTKEVGKGTGLGLATVYGIVKQSGGYIWVYSEVGYGTTFKIYLPLVADLTETKESELVSIVPPRGVETILLVEDEEIVRNLSRLILEECGYKIIEACNGVQALEIVKQSNTKINLLITDIVMPEMGGRKLAEIFSVTFPQLKVLFMSGYTDDTVIRHGIIDANSHFIQKPFTFDNLAAKVREILD